MSHIRSINTGPELQLRHTLWQRGFRYRVNDRRLPGSPDIVLPKHRSVIFVHGCFWHGHKGCRYYTVPKTHTDFWTAKVERNQARDQETWRQLEAKGWRVVIVWECQLKKAALDATIDRIVAELLHNEEQYRSEQAARLKAKQEYLTAQKAKKAKELALRREVKAY